MHQSTLTLSVRNSPYRMHVQLLGRADLLAHCMLDVGLCISSRVQLI